MATRTTTENPYYGSGNGYWSTWATREINPVKAVIEPVSYVPEPVPTVGQAWPRGNV